MQLLVENRKTNHLHILLLVDQSRLIFYWGIANDDDE